MGMGKIGIFMAARMSYHHASPLVVGSSKDILISTTPWEILVDLLTGTTS